MNTTVRARRVNNNMKSIGKHWTLTRVVNEPDQRRVFGYCQDDEGEEAYIPAVVIKQHKMSEYDVGAGFTAPSIDNPRAVAETSTGAERMIQLPLIWDGGAESLEVIELDGPDGPDQAELDAVEADLVQLAEATDGMLVDACAQLDGIMKSIRDLEHKIAMRRIEELSKKLAAYRAYIDEKAPQDGC